MNYTQAACGHPVIAVGAPGSMARRAQESRHCGLPRCESQLPSKFTDRECAAFVWCCHRQIGGWAVDMLDKSVAAGDGKRHAGLIEFAQHHGWEG